jgi:hypothetical protein
MAHETTTKGKTMNINYIDSDTLAIARLVASAEGISLEQAIAEELELWDGVATR